MEEEINYKLIAERLWSILDDIDTAFDHYKPDMKDNFVNYVNEKCQDRFSYGFPEDGYVSTFTWNNNVPVIEDLDPMCRWFKDAWRIEKDRPTEVTVPPIGG